MKLDKQVCKECYGKEYELSKESIGEGLWTRFTWNIFTDDMWMKGHVWCIKKEKITDLSSIPDECEYKLEHKVIGQNEAQ